MTHATYDSYKESGIPWLGKVPAGWEVVRLKNCAEVRPSNVDKKTNEGEIPVKLCNYVDVYYNDKITDEIKFMSATANQNEIARFTLNAGDVVITKDSESANDIGVPTLITDKASNIVCGYHLAIIKGYKDTVYGAYLFYLIKSEPSARQFEVMSNGVTRFALPYGAIKNLNITLPPLAEQKAIAEFLDNKTAQIDALIAKKKNLLKLLAEQRTALITNTVTRGLDKSASMKESGITWLGKVPNHWEVKPLKYLVDYNSESLPETTNPGLLIKYVDLSSVSPIVGITKNKEIEFKKAPSRARRIVRDGDTIIPTVGAQRKSITTIKNPEENLIVSTGFAVIRSKKDIRPDYLGYFLQNDGFIGESVSKAVGVIYSTINASDLVRVESVLPPLAEQKAIADFLDCKTAEIDATKDRITTAIDTLKEYRTALITNAVTGKIKVV